MDMYGWYERDQLLFAARAQHRDLFAETRDVLLANQSICKSYVRLHVKRFVAVRATTPRKKIRRLSNFIRFNDPSYLCTRENDDVAKAKDRNLLLCQYRYCLSDVPVFGMAFR
jgi:hypothetical protein